MATKLGFGIRASWKNTLSADFADSADLKKSHSNLRNRRNLRITLSLLSQDVQHRLAHRQHAGADAWPRRRRVAVRVHRGQRPAGLLGVGDFLRRRSSQEVQEYGHALAAVAAEILAAHDRRLFLDVRFS